MTDSLAEHHVDWKVLADIAQKFDIAKLRHPVIVVHQNGGRLTDFKIQQLSHLDFDTCQIFCQLLVGQQVALGALAARVADHSGRPSDDGDWPVSCLLKSAKHHEWQQATNVQAVSGWIKAGVNGSRAGCQPVWEKIVGGRLMDQPPPLQVAKDIRHESRFLMGFEVQCSRISNRI